MLIQYKHVISDIVFSQKLKASGNGTSPKVVASAIIDKLPQNDIIEKVAYVPHIIMNIIIPKSDDHYYYQQCAIPSAK